MRTDGQADMTKLIVRFSQFRAIAHKNSTNSRLLLLLFYLWQTAEIDGRMSHSQY
jgi:hypothetical protein